MRLLAALFVASFAVTGCAVAPDQGDEDGTAEDQGALSTWAQGLTGSYATTDKTTDFDRIVLEGNGKYFAESDVVCIKAPCNPVRVDGKWTATKPSSGHPYGFLRLYPAGSSEHSTYRVRNVAEHSSFELSTDGKVYAKYASNGTYCGSDSDCDGQSYIHPMCVGTPACNVETKTCSWHCGTKPVCDYSDTTKSWISKDPAKCAAIRFVCEAGKEPFFGDCGCGCQPAAPACHPADEYIKTGSSCLINFLCTKDKKAFKDACGCGCEPL